MFSLATDLLQLVIFFYFFIMLFNLNEVLILILKYHLTAKYDSDKNTNNLILLLNADLQYIKWKKSINGKHFFHDFILHYT